MSRNNEERLGATSQVETPVAPIVEPPPAPTTGATLGQGSVGLNFVVPTEFVELPSGGEFYPPDHPLHSEDTVEIRHMTAREEEILTSRTLLKKGVALDRLIESVLVNKQIKPDSLLVGDKNAILIMSRAVAYGPDYTTRVTCPECMATSKHTFNLMAAQHEAMEGSEEETVQVYTRTDNNTFLLTLPRTNVQVEVRLLTGADERWLTKTMERKKKSKSGIDSVVAEQMRLFIVSLNGITDKTAINKFINSMPAADSRFLRNTYAELSPNIDLTQDFTCPECGETSEMEVPFTAEFFWPKQ